jgi:hypothetical protein
MFQKIMEIIKEYHFKELILSGHNALIKLPTLDIAKHAAATNHPAFNPDDEEGIENS